jgi:hypothetical protein
MTASELEHDVYAELTKTDAAAGTGTAGAGATAGQAAATH